MNKQELSSAYLGFGSNLGDKVANVKQGADLLAREPGVRSIVLSPLYRSAPVGNIEQDWFVNGVARVTTTLRPRELLECCLEVERRLKRERRERWGPRTLDIDLLLFGDERLDEPGLQIPHPRMTERAFVLAPLADLDAGLRIHGRRVDEWLSDCRSQLAERIEPPSSGLVAIVGASPKTDRYSHRAQLLLMDKGYAVAPVSPGGAEVLGVPGFRDLREIPGPVDTVTIYVGAARVEALGDALIAKRPRRAIFNPGTENAALMRRLEAAGIEVEAACTLVLLGAELF